jgi:hypothetical protein
VLFLKKIVEILQMKNHNQELFETIKKFKKISKREYKFLPVAKEEDIVIFENKFKVKLPSEYRWFLLNIANGIISKKDWNFDILDKIDFKNYWCNDEYDPSISFELDKRVLFSEPEEDEDIDNYPYETYLAYNMEVHNFYNCYKTGVIHISDEGCGTYSILRAAPKKRFGFCNAFASTPPESTLPEAGCTVL